MKYTIVELKKKYITPGLFSTLAHLSSSTVNNVDKGRKQFKRIRKNKNHYIFVALEKKTREVIGATTVLIEPKFIHDCGFLAHVEDVVVRPGYEGQGIGRALMEKAMKTAQQADCYRVLLDCHDTNVKFYEKLGFSKRGNEMIHNL
ncbi:MAG: GNAT family N-acetyltransferase [Patescibacteria group bacterium]